MLRPNASMDLLRTLLIDGISLAVGLGLVLNRRNNPDLPRKPWPKGKEAPRAEIVAPVRNEERNIGPLLVSLLAQQYPAGRWGVTVVDDGSTDATANIAYDKAEGKPHIRVVQAGPLPNGWTGKNHAMYSGYLASPPGAEWLLFVDADTRHDPLMLSSVLNRALETGADLLSLVLAVEIGSFWEAVIVPQAGELYTLLVGTMDQVNSHAETAAANGQFLLVRRVVYGALGSLETVRSDVAEDRAFAAECKARGYRVRLEYGRTLVHSRVYASLREMWAGYSKTLFWATGHRTGRSLAVAIALAFYGLTPIFTLLRALTSNRAKRPGTARHAVLQIVPMLAVRAYVCRQFGISPLYALTYPLAVIIGDAMLLNSVFRVLLGIGVVWKGRLYK